MGISRRRRCAGRSKGPSMGIIETSAALGACLLVLIVTVVLDRRPYRPRQAQLHPDNDHALAATLVLGRHLLSLVAPVMMSYRNVYRAPCRHSAWESAAPPAKCRSPGSRPKAARTRGQ